MPADGGTMSVPVTTTSGNAGAASCQWTVVVNDDARPFVALVDPASGLSTAGSATVAFTVAPNSGGERRGTFSIATVPFTVTQAAAACAFGLSGDLNASFPASGGTGRITVTPTQGANCQWSASSGASFITVSPASGTNAGTVTYTVAPNSDQARTGTLTIAGQAITVQQASGLPGTPSITSVSPTTIPVGSSLVTISGSGFDPATVQVAVTGGACPASLPCLVTNAELTSRTATQIIAPVNLLSTGTYTIQTRNGSSGPLSNGVTLTVVQAAPAPTITSVSPTTMTVGLASLTIAGSGFDTATVQVAVTGPGCPLASPCLVTNGELTSRSSTQIVAPVTLRTSGQFTIQARNGTGGSLSNGLNITVVSAPAPTITNLSPNTISPGTAQLTITGNGFDPGAIEVAVTGGGCPASSPCRVTNGELTSRSTTQIVAPVTLGSSGQFTIQVRNGVDGALSNGVALTVR